MALWLVRAGKYGEHEPRFFEDNRIYLTWEALTTDLSTAKTYNDIKAIMQAHYPGEPARRVGNWSGQAWAFALAMKPGDWIVVPRKAKGTIAVGEITSGYQFDAKTTTVYNHYRSVKWLHTDVPRSAFDQDLLYSIGAIMTVCEIKRNDAEKRVRAMAKAGWKSVPVKPVLGATAAPSDAEAAEEGLQILLERIRPDAIVLDNVIMFPAIANAGCPWIRIISCAETELPDPDVPPYLSGLAAGDPECQAFEAAYLKATGSVHRRYNRLRRKHGLAPLPDGIFLEPSPQLNFLLAPGAVRYERKVPLPGERFVFLEGCVRKENHFSMPALPVEDGPLIYMSFGSLGAIDTGLISRMIDVFATIPARFLVNVGSFLDAYETVPDNVFLGSWFPQPSVVAESDLFIHHGGNNSFCEALYFGVPSLIMPYCWDGHDNAQRAAEKGIGRRIDRAAWTPDELRAEILGLLNDGAMRQELGTISDYMKAHSGTERAARTILDAIGQK